MLASMEFVNITVICYTSTSRNAKEEQHATLLSTFVAGTFQQIRQNKVIHRNDIGNGCKLYTQGSSIKTFDKIEFQNVMGW